MARLAVLSGAMLGVNCFALIMYLLEIAIAWQKGYLYD